MRAALDVGKKNIFIIMALPFLKVYRFLKIFVLICIGSIYYVYGQLPVASETRNLTIGNTNTISSIIAKSGQQINRGAYDSSIITCRQGIALCNNTSNGHLKLSSLYNYMGASFQFKGDYDSAIYFFYMAAEKAIAGKNGALQLIRVYNNLSLAFNRTLHNDKAMAYLEKAEQLAKQNNLGALIPSMLLNKGRIYKEEQQFQLSERAFLDALVYCDTAKGIESASGSSVDVLRLMIYTNLGQLLIEQGNYAAAKKYLVKALPLSADVNPYYQVSIRMAMGKVYLHEKEYVLAEQNMHFVVDKSELSQISEGIAEGNYYLSKIYSAQEKYEQAYEYLAKSYDIEEEIRGIEQTKESRLLEIKYRTAQKDKEIAERKLTLVQKDRLLKTKNVLIVGISLGTFLLAILFLGVYKNHKHGQRLQEQKILAIEQGRHIELLKASADGEERERSRIAGNLHDGIGSLISAAKMNFSTLHTLDSDKAVYEKSMKLLNDAAFEIRSTAHNLMPQMLLRHGLVAATREFCERMSNSQALAIDYQAYGTFLPQEKNVELFIYRIIQELVNNVIKHSGASQALVQLSMSHDLLAITVEDNGKGMLQEQMAGNKGAGLKNMEDKIGMLNGSITIDSTPGKGTQIYLEFDFCKPSIPI